MNNEDLKLQCEKLIDAEPIMTNLTDIAFACLRLLTDQVILREALIEIQSMSQLDSEEFMREREKTSLVHTLDTIAVTARTALENLNRS